MLSHYSHLKCSDGFYYWFLIVSWIKYKILHSGIDIKSMLVFVVCYFAIIPINLYN